MSFWGHPVRGNMCGSQCTSVFVFDYRYRTVPYTLHYLCYCFINGGTWKTKRWFVIARSHQATSVGMSYEVRDCSLIYRVAE